MIPYGRPPPIQPEIAIQSFTTKLILPMAITLNKIAVRCNAIAEACGKITSTSSAQPMLYDISRNWRSLLDATNYKSDVLPEWSEKEELAGEVMISALTYLQRIGCRNIEQLLKDIVELHARQQ